MAEIPAAKLLSQFQQTLSHQEMSRIVEDLEALCLTISNTNGPDQYVTSQSAVTFLAHDLGYEDPDGFELSLGGTFEDFIKCMPFLEYKTDSENEGLLFRLKPRPSVPQYTKKVFKITKSEDLWRVVMKTVTGYIEIPEIEFEIGFDHSRNIDAIYNHISQAMFNLTQHVRQGRDTISSDHKEKILATCCSLHSMLDLEEPWTFILHDSEGTSEIHPEDGVYVERVGESRGGGMF